MNVVTDPQVLVVGAGPTGLVLALWLHRAGIRVRIIDKNTGPGTTSRAIAVQARTLEFYRQLGLSDELLREGIAVPQMRMLRAGRTVARANFGAPGAGQCAFPYLFFYPQDQHEAFLVGVLAQASITVERNVECTAFTQDERGVTATLTTARGRSTVRCEYLVGADGAHSVVRHAIGAEFAGGTYSQIFYVADVRARGEAASGGLQFSVSWEDFCIVMPVRQTGSVRLIGIVPPRCEGKDKIEFDDVKGRVTSSTGLRIDELRWFSSYRVHHRVASRFRDRRVFIAGDAGHIHSPAGGQGMNTGIGDAVNLAWKLSEVLHGRFTAQLLDSYESERRGFAKVLVASTDRMFTFMASRSFLGSFWRSYLLPLVFAFVTRFPFALRAMFRLLSQLRISYRDSALSFGGSERLHAGDRLPWIDFGGALGDNHAPLTSREWQLHVYGDRRAAAIGLAGIPLHVFPASAETARKGLTRNALYLVRPDGHLAFVSTSADGAELREYLGRVGALGI